MVCRTRYCLGKSNYYLNKQNLENRLKQTKHLEANETLTENSLKQKLAERIQHTDWDGAKNDVINLIKDQSSLELWSNDFFNVICDKIKVQ